MVAGSPFLTEVGSAEQFAVGGGGGGFTVKLTLHDTVPSFFSLGSVAVPVTV
jgi:hypothetical protein